MQGHTRTCVCAHTRTHTCTQAHTCTHTCGHTSTTCVCICSSRFLEPLSPTPLIATCRGNFGCLVVEMVTCVASWYDCTSKQSGYVQLSVREDSEKSAVRNLTGMVSVGLCVLCLLSVLRHHCYFTCSVTLKKLIFTCLMHVFGVKRLDVTHLRIEDDVAKNVLSLRKITIASVAVTCRRVGSKRVKSVPASKKTYYKMNNYVEQKRC